jgi:hypothetical protein
VWIAQKNERIENKKNKNEWSIRQKQTTIELTLSTLKKPRHNITLEKEAVSSSVLIEKLFRFGTRLRGLGF